MYRGQNTPLPKMMNTRAHSIPDPAAKGFTLIEIMLVVAIIAILAAVAGVSLSEYPKRAKTTEAMNNLPALKLMLDSRHVSNGTYPVEECAEVNSNTKYFMFSCELTEEGYLIAAIGRPDSGMGGYRYTVDQDHNMATEIAGNRIEGCWKSSNASRC